MMLPQGVPTPNVQVDLMNWKDFIPGPQHGIIDVLLIYLVLVLYKHGIKFDVHIWRNGKQDK